MCAHLPQPRVPQLPPPPYTPANHCTRMCQTTSDPALRALYDTASTRSEHVPEDPAPARHQRGQATRPQGGLLEHPTPFVSH
eukprot:12316782-Prorocentrum_lima.AAC.1